MNSSETITINSMHVAQAVDSQIIMLIKTIQVENKSTIEDAFETGRDYLNKKVIELMHMDDKKNILEISNNIKNKFKDNPKNKEFEKMYQLCNYFGLYKYLE